MDALEWVGVVASVVVRTAAVVAALLSYELRVYIEDCLRVVGGSILRPDEMT